MNPRKRQAQVLDKTTPAQLPPLRRQATKSQRMKSLPANSSTKEVASSTPPRKRNAPPKRKKNAPATDPGYSSSTESSTTSLSRFQNTPSRPLASNSPLSPQSITSPSLRNRSSTCQRPSYANHFPPLDEHDPSSISESDALNLFNSVSPSRQAQPNEGYVATRLSPLSSRFATEPLKAEKESNSQAPESMITIHSNTMQSINSSSRRCNRCVMKHRRCDGNRPQCQRCIGMEEECVYHHEPITRTFLENLEKQTYLNNMNKQAGNLRDRQSTFAGLVEGRRPPFSEVLEPVEKRAGRLALDEQTIMRTLFQGQVPQAQQGQTTRGGKVEQKHMNGFPLEMATRWAYENHLEFHDALEQGSAPNGPGAAVLTLSDEIFDETTKEFEDFQNENDLDGGSELNLRWGHPRDKRVVADGSLSQGGLTDHLRRRMRLLSRGPDLSIERHLNREPFDAAPRPWEDTKLWPPIPGAK